jgi:HEAT repeat protein
MSEPEDVIGVRNLIHAIQKARKNLRIYPANNPVYTNIVEQTYQRLASVLEFQDELSLRFTKNDILYGSDPVFHSEGKDDNLALFFSRDGVKDLTFKSGISMDEFQEFLKIASYDLDKEDIADDVVTLMWGKDFKNINYTVDESTLIEEDEEKYEEGAVKQVKDRAAEKDDVQRAYSDALRSEETVKEIRLVPITNKDLKILASLREKFSQDKKSKLADILYEMLLQTQDHAEFREIASLIGSCLEYCMRERRIDTAVEIMWRAKSFDDKSITGFNAREELSLVFRKAESAEMIKILGDMLDEEPGIEGRVFRDYVSFLSKNAIPQFMIILGELKTIKARKSVVNALVFLGKKDISTLVRGLSDSRWYLVRNIIYILRKIGDPKAVDYLLRASGHSDPRVRKEMLRALGEIGGEKAAAAVGECLDDPEPFVRTSAARALGAIGTETAMKMLMSRISHKNFLNADFNEKKEYFEALSRWHDSRVQDFLLKIVKKRVFFKRMKYGELKAGAAYALGLMGNKDTLPALDKLRKSGNRLVSGHSYAAIKRIEHGRLA